MRWGKILLLFQALVTLAIGMAFFSQLTIIGGAEISDLVEEVASGESFENNVPPTITDIRNRYTIAAYMLLIIGLIETIIITRLLR